MALQGRLREGRRPLRRALWALPLVAATLSVPTSAGPRDLSPPLTRAYVDQGSDGPARVRLEAVDIGPSGLRSTQVRVDGGAWRPYRLPAPEVLFDGTTSTFRRWQHVGAGSFVLQRNGTMRTEGGLGMLWYPVKQYGSAELHLRWRRLAPPPGSTGSYGNSGVVVRFPDPVEAVAHPKPCQAGVGIATLGLVAPEYAAIDCGNEIQINDASPADPQRTGSIYDFSFLHDPQQRPVPVGRWTDYVVRVVGGEEYSVTVVRDGHVINEWVNTPGQLGWRSTCYCAVPAEHPGDAPSDLRRFASGYLGLQNHGAADLVEFGRVTVQDLSGAAGAFTVGGTGAHVVEFRSTDRAGNVEPVQRVRFVVGGGAVTELGPPGPGCDLGPQAGSTTRQTCRYVATSALGRYDARTTTVWSIRVTRGRSSWLVAAHPSAPALPVSGTFPTQRGDQVTVTLGPDLTSSRDNNVVVSGGLGSIHVADAE